MENAGLFYAHVHFRLSTSDAQMRCEMDSQVCNFSGRAGEFAIDFPAGCDGYEMFVDGDRVRLTDAPVTRIIADGGTLRMVLRRELMLEQDGVMPLAPVDHPARDFAIDADVGGSPDYVFALDSMDDRVLAQPDAQGLLAWRADWPVAAGEGARLRWQRRG